MWHLRNLVSMNYFSFLPLTALLHQRYPEGVKMLVISFKDQFGQTYGNIIREWCIHNKWALAFSLHSDKACLDPRRLLDPYVLVSREGCTVLWRIVCGDESCNAVGRHNCQRHDSTCCSHSLRDFVGQRCNEQTLQCDLRARMDGLC